MSGGHSTSGPASGGLPSRPFTSQQRTSYRAACVISLILAVLWVAISWLAAANMPTGGKIGLEVLAGVLFLSMPPALAWYLFHATQVGMRVVVGLAWAPIVLLAVGIPVAIVITG